MQLDAKALEAAVEAVADSEGWNAEDMHITRRTAQAAVAAYLTALGEKPVAWRVLVNDNGKRMYHYTECLPFEPLVGSWVKVRAEPEPLFTSPQPVAVSGNIATITIDEAKRLCARLEFDSSWDKAGSGYYALKRQIKDREAALAADGRG